MYKVTHVSGREITMPIHQSLVKTISDEPLPFDEKLTKDVEKKF